MSEEKDESRISSVRLAAARDARAQSELFAQIIETMPDGLILVDGSGIIQFVNRQAELLFGYPRSELIGREHNTLVPPTLRTVHDQHRRDYQRQPHARAMGGLGTLLKGLHKDGGEFDVDIMLAPIVVEQGIFTVAVIRLPKT